LFADISDEKFHHLSLELGFAGEELALRCMSFAPCLDNSNLRLRRSYREITKAAPTTAILTRKRHEIEAELLRWYGHPDINRPVLTDAHPTLIALIRDGLIKAATLQAIQ
jgi:hypothetical protein